VKRVLNRQRNGFAPTQIILVVLLVAVVGVAGWFVVQNNSSDDASSEVSTQSSEQAQVQSVPIESSEDIDAAVTELEAIPVDTDLDTAELDQDIQAVL
jgi:uncharacterized membrane protein